MNSLNFNIPTILLRCNVEIIWDLGDWSMGRFVQDWTIPSLYEFLFSNRNYSKNDEKNDLFNI